MDTDSPQADPEPGSCTSSKDAPQEPPPSTSLLCLDISDSTQSLSRDRVEWLHDTFSRCCRLMLPLLGAPHDIRIRIVDDEAMISLHQQHKKTAGTTDVLTFDLRESSNEPLDTDVVLCLDEAARQADARELDVCCELVLYAVHGILHCLGHNDQDEASASAMHRREDEILQAIGLDRVFDKPTRGGAASS